MAWRVDARGELLRGGDRGACSVPRPGQNAAHPTRVIPAANFTPNGLLGLRELLDGAFPPETYWGCGGSSREPSEQADEGGLFAEATQQAQSRRAARNETHEAFPPETYWGCGGSSKFTTTSSNPAEVMSDSSIVRVFSSARERSSLLVAASCSLSEAAW